MSSHAGSNLGWMQESQIAGATALIVGGGSGIGAATARMMAANGASVMIADRNAEQARLVAAGIIKAGGEAAAIGLDLAESAQIHAAVDLAGQTFGGIDILVNTAAFVKAAQLDDGPLDEWDQSFRVNVQAALELLAHLPELGSACADGVRRHSDFLRECLPDRVRCVPGKLVLARGNNPVQVAFDVAQCLLQLLRAACVLFGGAGAATARPSCSLPRLPACTDFRAAVLMARARLPSSRSRGRWGSNGRNMQSASMS